MFDNLKKVTSFHACAIVFALVVGVVYAAPDFTFLLSTPAPHASLMYTDAERYYLARIHATSNGCVLTCNPYIKEYAYQLPFFDLSLSELVLDIPEIAFGIKVTMLKVVYEFLFPSILFLLVYSFVFQLSKKRSWSVVAGLAILFGYNLFNSTDFINLINLKGFLAFRPDIWGLDYLIYSRPVNPQFSLLFFWAYLHVLLLMLKKPSWKRALTVGVVYGVTFYVYFFIATFVTVMQGIWFLVALLQKNISLAKKMAISSVVGLVLGVPVLYEYYIFLHHPFYGTTLTQTHLVHTHVPDIHGLGIAYLVLLAAIVGMYIKRNKPLGLEFTTVLVLIGSCFVLRNQHVISGMILLYDHYERYLFTPILVVSSCFFGSHFIRASLTRVFITVLAGIFIVYGATVQGVIFQYGKSFAIEDSKASPLISWLNSKPKGLVLSAPERVANLIPIYTSDFILTSFYARLYMYVPGRFEEIDMARSSLKSFEVIARKYGVDYYIEDKKNNLFQDSNKVKVYEDENYIVYPVRQ